MFLVRRLEDHDPPVFESPHTIESESAPLEIEVGDEIELQENNSIVLYIDSYNNSGTGLSVGGIGADVKWRFGNRNGVVYSSDGLTTSVAYWG